ncbi:MAG: hypothetical protein WCO84_01080 [bacterium]
MVALVIILKLLLGSIVLLSFIFIMYSFLLFCIFISQTKFYKKIEEFFISCGGFDIFFLILLFWCISAYAVGSMFIKVGN